MSPLHVPHEQSRTSSPASPDWVSDRRWIWTFAILVVVITSLPYLMGYAREGPDWRYSGFLFGVEDGNSYIAKMLLGASGDWLFHTPYSPVPHHGVPVFLPYLLLGKLSAPPGQHEQLVALYQLFRLAAGVGLVFSVYHFLSIFLRETTWRRFGTALVVLGGGLGWLSAVGAGRLWRGQLPLDFYSPETFGFLMLFSLPHLAGARALVLWGLHDYLHHPGQEWKIHNLLKAVLIWIGAGLMQPITVIVSWAVLVGHLAFTGAWQAWLSYRKRPAEWTAWRAYFFRAIRIGLISSPLVLFTYAVIKLDPILSSWEAQNRLISPSFDLYLLSYGLLFPLTLLGVRTMLNRKSWHGMLILAWAALFPFLIYLPVGVQRRLVEGAWIAIVMIALTWVENRGRTVRRWVSGWLVFSFLSPLLFFSGSFSSVWNPDVPLYRPADEVGIFQYLAENARSSEVVLASFEVSNALPAWAPLKVVTGHGPEGLNSYHMRQQVERFFGMEMTDSERVDFLKEYGVTYVLWGPVERAISDWDPREVNYLLSIYESGEYSLFRSFPVP